VKAETWRAGTFDVDLLIECKLVARVSDEEFVEQRLNHGRSRHLTDNEQENR